METKTNQIDYRVIRHADVFLLMPQNDEAKQNLEENFTFVFDDYDGEGAWVRRPFNKNGGMIIRAEHLRGWLEYFADIGWEVDDEL